MNKLLYAIHKWLSAAAFVQLAIWTVSGSFFAWTKQESMKSAPVAGAHRGVISAAPAADVGRAIEAGRAAGAGDVERVELVARPSGAFYVVRGDRAVVRLDARTGALAAVTREEAEATARRDQPGDPAVKDATLVTAGPPIEYRDCESGDCALPAWRVSLADAAGTNVWVDATTGEVTTRRNDVWRTYDFLWSLHIMDYKERESFHHPLMWIAATAALLTVLTGIILLGVRTVRWWSRKLRRPAAA
jgi:hypothetical protein